MSEIQQHLEKGYTFTPAVVGLIVDEENQRVLLGFRQSATEDLGIGLYSGIGGKRGDEPGCENETDKEAMVREAREEVGIEVIGLELKGRVRFIFPHKPASWSQDVAIFLIRSWSGEPHQTNEGKIVPTWVPLTAIPYEKMWIDNAEWWPKILAGEMIDAVFLYGKDGGIREKTFA